MATMGGPELGRSTAPAAKAAATDVQLGANNGPGPGAGRQPGAVAWRKRKWDFPRAGRGQRFPTDHTTATSASQATEILAGQREISPTPGAALRRARPGKISGREFPPRSRVSQAESSSQSPRRGRTAAGGERLPWADHPRTVDLADRRRAARPAISMSLTPSASSQSLARTRGGTGAARTPPTAQSESRVPLTSCASPLPCGLIPSWASPQPLRTFRFRARPKPQCNHSCRPSGGASKAGDCRSGCVLEADGPGSCSARRRAEIRTTASVAARKRARADSTVTVTAVPSVTAR